MTRRRLIKKLWRLTKQTDQYVHANIVIGALASAMSSGNESELVVAIAEFNDRKKPASDVSTEKRTGVVSYRTDSTGHRYSVLEEVK